MEKVFASVRFSSPLSFAVARTSQSPFPLAVTLKDTVQTSTDDKKRTDQAHPPPKHLVKK